MNYRKYIASFAWRGNAARLREFEAAGFQCRLCPNSVAQGYSLHAHHRTYERFGCERDGDLTALCPPCHDGVTSMLRARRYHELAAVAIHDVECANHYPHPLFDPEEEGVKT